MGLKIVTLDDAPVVIMEPSGSLIGGPETDEVKSAIAAEMAKGTTRIVLDLGKVEYLNSSAIGVLTVTHTTLQAKGGKLMLCNINKSIANVFLVTKLSTIFLSEETRNEAILAVGK